MGIATVAIGRLWGLSEIRHVRSLALSLRAVHAQQMSTVITFVSAWDPSHLVSEALSWHSFLSLLKCWQTTGSSLAAFLSSLKLTSSGLKL